MGTVVYISGFVTKSIQQTHNINLMSQAGYHKITNIIESLRLNDKNVIVVSPIIPTGSVFVHQPVTKHTHPENGTDILTPRSVNLFNISIINNLFLLLFTTSLVIQLVIKEKICLFLYYNLDLSRAFPAVVGSILACVPLLLEYEDGRFVNTSTSRSLSIRLARYISKPWLDGAVCVNNALAERAPTENTVIFRGFPSVGLPKNLPDSEYDGEEYVVMYAGKFDRIRGVHTFIDIVERHEEFNCEYWVSGWGKEEEFNAVKNRVESIGNDRIKFFGKLPFNEYRERCVQADILINPQDPSHPISEYTFPSKILDFLSSGSVVISTDMADLQPKMSDVLVIDGKTRKSLGQSLRATLNTNDKVVEEQKELGEQWIHNHCDHQRIGDKIINLGKK